MKRRKDVACSSILSSPGGKAGTRLSYSPWWASVAVKLIKTAETACDPGSACASHCSLKVQVQDTGEGVATGKGVGPWAVSGCCHERRP